MKKITSLMLLTLFLAGAVTAAIYKWVDEEGKVHYGDCPPPECKSEQIETPPGPSEKDIQRSQERIERLLLEQKQTQEIRKREREIKRKQDEYRRAALKKRCKVLRSELFLLT